jgi:Sigma-70 region 2
MNRSAGDHSHDTIQLLRLHRDGDPAALGLLLERYQERVERIVRVRMGPTLRAREDAADIVQDVFLRVNRSIDDYEQRGHPARWSSRDPESLLGRSPFGRRAPGRQRGGPGQGGAPRGVRAS